MTYVDNPQHRGRHRPEDGWRVWPTSTLGRARALIPTSLALALIAVLAMVYPVGAAEYTESLWNNLTTPRVLSHSDSKPVELGVKFSATVAGKATGVRFYKGMANTGSHRGNLWTVDGELLATVAFKNETQSGWQSATFEQPVVLKPNQLYVVSYHTTSGYYSADTRYFTSRVRRGHLRSPASTADNPNGVYRYGAESGFPTDSYRATNYWVDVVFRPDAQSPNPPDPSPSPSASASPTGTPTAGPSATPSQGPTSTPPPGGGCTPPNCGTAAPPFPAPPGKTWKMSFSEEFNNNTYDRKKLTPCFDWNYGACTASFNQGREHYDPAQVVVNNGTAKLIAAPLSPPKSSNGCQNKTCTYKAGLLSTARPHAGNGSDYLYKFTYGYVEARIKFPATRGFFTAFWMVPADPSYNYRSEIDILELLGDDPTTMFMTYHYNNRGSSFNVNRGKFNNGACATKNYSTDFVRVGMDWQANRIAWYIDGVKCAEFTNASQIENGPMQILLHMMVDNNWQRQWNVGLTDPTLVRQLEVDYLRVFQHA